MRQTLLCRERCARSGSVLLYRRQGNTAIGVRQWHLKISWTYRSSSESVSELHELSMTMSFGSELIMKNLGGEL